MSPRATPPRHPDPEWDPGQGLHVPPPPPPGELPETTLTAGTVLHRVHEVEFGAVEFNPGSGRGRFSFFDDSDGDRVPVLYAGQTAEVAVFETVFHDAMPGEFKPRSAWETRVASTIRVNRVVRLAQLHSPGLNRLGVRAEELTATAPTLWGQTVAWAQAAHAQGLDGLVWMSRQYNTHKAYMFFGDRFAAGDLVQAAELGPEQVFAHPAGEAWLAGLAESAGILLGL